MALENITVLNDYEAERRLLAALILVPHKINTYKHWDIKVFTTQLHKVIWGALKKMDISWQDSIDPAVLVSQVNMIDDSIPSNVIENVTTAVLTPSWLKLDADIVLKYYKLRQLNLWCTTLKNDIANKKDLESLEQNILKLLQTSREKIYEEQSIESLLNEVLDDNCEPVRFLTTYRDIDANINWFKPGQLIVIGARPWMGKTSLMLNFALEQALNNIKTMFISLEMSNRELIQRMFAAQSWIHYKKIEQKNFTEQDIVTLKAAKETLKDIPLTLVDNAFGFNQIMSIIRDKYEKDWMDVVYIDYLQLLSINNPNWDRNLEIGAFTRQIKMLAKELGIAIVIGSQLNRQAESRFDKRPLLADLRASWSIEQDADMVMLLYRDAYYNQDLNEAEAKLLEINIAKHRNGSCETLMLDFDGPVMKISNNLKQSFNSFR